MTNKLVVIINSLKVPKIEKNFTINNEISCTKLQLPPEPLTRGPPPPDPRSVCPQLNLLNPLPNKIPGYATVVEQLIMKAQRTKRTRSHEIVSRLKDEGTNVMM